VLKIKGRLLFKEVSIRRKRKRLAATRKGCEDKEGCSGWTSNDILVGLKENALKEKRFQTQQLELFTTWTRFQRGQSWDQRHWSKSSS
jgi:hypothetical protein